MAGSRKRRSTILTTTGLAGGEFVYVGLADFTRVIIYYLKNNSTSLAVWVGPTDSDGDVLYNTAAALTTGSEAAIMYVLDPAPRRLYLEMTGGTNGAVAVEGIKEIA